MKKISDFWFFYKGYIIALLIVALLCVLILKDCSEKIHEDLAVTMLLSNDAKPESSQNIANALEEGGKVPDFNGDGNFKARVNLVTVPYEVKDESDLASQYQANIAIQADESQLFFIDEDLLEIYEEQELFGDIGDLAEGLNAQNLYIDENGKAIGISLKGNAFLEDKGIVTETLYACLRNNEYTEPDEEADKIINASVEILKFIVE